MSDTAQVEYNSISNAIKTDAGIKAIAENAPLMGLPGEALNSILTNPICGNTLENWISKLEANTLQGIKHNLMSGLILGKGINDISRDIKNTFGMSSAQAKTLTRTAIMDASNKALQQCYNDNSEFIETYRFVATLDHKTCLLCAKLDGKTGDILKLKKVKEMKKEEMKKEEMKKIPITVVAGENVSADFVININNYIKTIPVPIQNALNKYGTTIKIGEFQTNINPHLINEKPTGWGKDASFDNVSGIYDWNNKQMSFAEKVTKIGSIDRSKVYKESISRVKGMTFHESGHAIDQLLGSEFFPKIQYGVFSNHDTGFVDAYIKDRANIANKKDPWDQATFQQTGLTYNQNKYAYLLQQKGIGQRETFAELFAVMMGQPSNLGILPDSYYEDWPNTASYMKDFLKKRFGVEIK